MRLILALFCSLLVISCSPKPTDPNFVVAEGNGFKITRAEMRQELESRMKMAGLSLDTLDAQTIGVLEYRTVEELITKKIFEIEVAKLPKVDQTERVQQEIEKIEKSFPNLAAFEDQLKRAGMTRQNVQEEIARQLEAERVIEAKVTALVNVTDEEVKAFYDGNAQLWDRPESVSAEVVTVLVNEKDPQDKKDAQRKKIDEAYARVNKGEDLFAVATEMSDIPQRKTSDGKLVPLYRGEMPEEFEKVAFSQKAGVLGKIFSSPIGLHFLKVQEKFPAKKIALEETKEDIKRHLEMAKRSQKAQEVIQQLRDAAGIKMHIQMPTPQVAPVAVSPAEMAK